MYDFKKIEEETRAIWKKKDKQIKKSLQNDPKKKIFSFLEGPPTANAPPGLHHLEVRTFKDIICKFKYMQGFSVPRKGGWDCHGLPVEVQVEKKLKLNSKKEVEIYGIDKFIKHCKEDVFSNIDDWSKSTEELAYWIDLKNPYITLDSDYIESVWWSLKELYKRGFLYEGYKVAPFCTRCGTPLSSHEVAQGYKDVTEESIYIAFQLKGKKDEYILAWTTTPWTLPGNVALAVGSNINYVKVKLSDGDKLILGKEKLNLIKGNYEIIEEFKGKKLVGLEYEPLYDIKETKNENSHKIILADFVTTEEGTGVVHTAVMYGEDDYRVGKEFGLPEIHTIGQDGKFLDIAPVFLRGRHVKETEKDIIENLKKRKILFKTEKITHAYPFCWRCDTPLLYYGINSWFVKTSKIKDKMIELNKKINWYPLHIKDGRFGMWLDGVKDWALSRFKFWGTPLPIWKCECGKETIIGSVEELEKHATKKFDKRHDLHKPWIDNIKLKCECGKEMTRVKDVIDCWYDSGSASFAQFHYPFKNKKEFEKRFPYDFIAEAVDQTRGWFYTLHALATILFNKPAYKNVICAGHIIDEKGEKMSKSKGNIIFPKEILEKVGVDAVRIEFCTSEPGSSKRFSYEIVKEFAIPFLTILYNCHSYYKHLENNQIKLKIEDKWILSRLNSLIKKVTDKLEKYSLNEAFDDIQNFVINDFSRAYIKMTRDREDTKEIVEEILEKICLLIAPFAPYISEFIYKDFSKESVHLSKWPRHNLQKIDENLEKEFNFALDIIEKGFAERDKIGIGLKWPLKIAKIKTNKKINKEILELIKSQINIKKIKIENADVLKVELDSKLTPELEEEGYAREFSRKVQAFRKEIGLEKKDKIRLKISTDDKLKKIFCKQKKFIKERTNSKSIEISSEKLKESEKHTTFFEIKNQKGGFSVLLD
jgi:isoleucyl-tRNA synthetase